MKRIQLISLAAVLLCAPIAARAADSPDGWLTTKAKVAVLSSVGTSGTKVHVDTNDGLVTLHGTVASSEDKNSAEDAVAKLDGVKKVRNLLEVVPLKQRDAVAASDVELQKKATKALRDDPALKSETGIEVHSVDNGTVVLGGKASTLSNHLRAIEDVRALRGVKRVASTIESPDSKAVRDASIGSRDFGREGSREETKLENRSSSDTGSGVRQTASDAYITTKAKARLFVDGKTPATSINVDTSHGVVTLFGTVTDAAAKRNAEAEVRKVDGVKEVRNEIEVVSPSAQDAVSKHDSAAERSVKRAVAHDKSMSNASISVEVRNGVARLTGTAPSARIRKGAEKIARRTDGVKSVRNEIEITND